MKSHKFQTLHCHSTTSDGELTHKQVLDECKKNNIEVVAFTDHDSLPTKAIINDLKKVKHEVKFITGIEMSATRVKEVADSIELFHIVGLFVDVENKNLLNYSNNSLNKRIERTKEIIKNCQEIGIHVTYDDVLKHVTGAVVGRPHIAKAILANDENIKTVKKLEDKLRDEAKLNKELTEKYEEVKQASLWQKVFSLFLSSGSYLKGVYVHYEDQVEMDDAIELIRGAGGIALLAHWSFMKNKLPLSIIEKFCAEKRIDGIETVYAFGIEENLQAEFETDMKNLEQLCEKYNLAKGGGGDFHRKEDFAIMNNPRFVNFANRTRGLIERILTLYPNLDKTHTSL